MNVRIPLIQIDQNVHVFMSNSVHFGFRSYWKTQRPRQRWKNRRRIIRLKCSVCSVWPVRVYFRFRVAHDSRAIKFYTLTGLRYETEKHGAWNEEKDSLGWRILERVKKRLLEQRNLVRSMLRSVSFVLLIKEHVYVCIMTEYTAIRYVS